MAALRQQIERLSAPAQGRVGVALAFQDNGESLLVGEGEWYPLQSVFKMPLALAVLAKVDRGTLRLDQIVRVDRVDYVSAQQHSPIRDAHPRGADLTVAELLRSAATLSDGTAADVLLGLIGGPAALTHYLKGLGIDGFEVTVTEKELGRDPAAVYRNRATPAGALAVLRAVDSGAGLSAASHARLLRLLTETPTGPRRLKGQLPADVRVAHKTGSSRTVDGLATATNDIGLLTLPDGRRVAVAVFIADSRADLATRERVIADVGRAAFDWQIRRDASNH